MRIEVRKTEFATPDLADDRYYEIYITRKQFMNEYEADAVQCTAIMQQIAEMYTSPHCFESTIAKEAIEGIYNYFIENKSAKGIVFHIVEADPYERRLKMFFVKV